MNRTTALSDSIPGTMRESVICMKRTTNATRHGSMCYRSDTVGSKGVPRRYSLMST